MVQLQFRLVLGLELLYDFLIGLVSEEEGSKENLALHCEEGDGIGKHIGVHSPFDFEDVFPGDDEESLAEEDVGTVEIGVEKNPKFGDVDSALKEEVFLKSTSEVSSEGFILDEVDLVKEALVGVLLIGTVEVELQVIFECLFVVLLLENIVETNVLVGLGRELLVEHLKNGVFLQRALVDELFALVEFLLTEFESCDWTDTCSGATWRGGPFYWTAWC